MSGIKKGKETQKEDGTGISTPYNFKQETHVDKDLNWEVANPDEVFTVKEQLGKGAYGAVYKAEFTKTGFPVAAKKIYDEKSAQATIKKEVDILKKCHSPFIVNYFGCLQGKTKEESKEGSSFKYPDGKEPLWILMDFCACGSVKDITDATGKPLSEDQVACVLLGVIQGIIYLHSQNIIHRDLKSGNILLSEDGSVKIADFGISTQLNASVTGNAKTMIGTTYWMAPEVMSERYDQKIDIWSLAITAIEMAELHPPNWNLKPFQLMLKLPKDPPPTLKEPNKFSKDFNDFLAKCLNKDSTKRPSAIQLLQHPFVASRLTKGIPFIQETMLAIVKSKRETK